MNAEKYLSRIRYSYDGNPTLENLNGLIYAHQCSVPFENLSIYDLDEPISLDSDALYEKIVVNNRGGYCFEMNKSFMNLLVALGYNAYPCYVRLVGPDGLTGPITHRGTIVNIQGVARFADVGFGGAMPPFAVEISEKPQVNRGETYWVEHQDDGWLMLKRLRGAGNMTDGENEPEVASIGAFTALPAHEMDFDPISSSFSTGENAPFKAERMVNLRTSTGYVGIRGNSLIKSTNGVRVETQFKDEELGVILKSNFNLRI